MATGKINAQEIGNGTDPVTLTKQSAAKAWCSWNGSGSTHNSFNVSSYTDTSATVDAIAFATNMDAADNYSVAASSNNSSGGRTSYATSVNMAVYQFDASGFTTANTNNNAYYNNGVVHGDLA